MSGTDHLDLWLSTVPDPALFLGLDPAAARAVFAYLYTKPRTPGKRPNLRSRAVALYDPMAKRSHFPAGVRFCVNCYTGCQHGCLYCYSTNYIRDPRTGRAKPNLRSQLRRDLRDIRTLGLPPFPISISNSTDFLQAALETRNRDGLFTLKAIAENQDLFSRKVALTKNPELLAAEPYLAVLKGIRGLQVEVSLTFLDDERRRFYEPGAPTVDSRMRGMRVLRENGIRVLLRADPLLPREPLPKPFFAQANLSSYEAPATHTEEELFALLHFAKEIGGARVVVSPLKVVYGKFRDAAFVELFKPLYAAASGGKPIAKGWAYRLPNEYISEHLIGPLVRKGQEVGVDVVHCRHNLLETV